MKNPTETQQKPNRNRLEKRREDSSSGASSSQKHTDFAGSSETGNGNRGKRRPSAEAVLERLEVPRELMHEGFWNEFRQWVEVRLTLKLSKDWVRLFQGQLDAQLAPLAREKGIGAAVECVQASRCNEWQGLFPEKCGAKNRYAGSGSGESALVEVDPDAALAAEEARS